MVTIDKGLGEGRRGIGKWLRSHPTALVLVRVESAVVVPPKFSDTAAGRPSSLQLAFSEAIRDKDTRDAPAFRRSFSQPVI